jgi:hypothetical protein
MEQRFLCSFVSVAALGIAGDVLASPKRVNILLRLTIILEAQLARLKVQISLAP